MEEIHLSVALVTRNRPATLERTLQSLRSQGTQPWEVIVSDDSDDNAAGEVTRLAANYGCQYIRGPQRGLYANRNQVALACRGTHIRTMDDDHEFPAGHFEECLKALRIDPACIWIIGEYYSEVTPRSTPPPCPGQLHPRGFSVAPPDPDRCWALADGAAIFPRTVFHRGVRYFEAFAFGAGYLEFGSRLNWLGYRIRQLPTTYVIHHYDPATRSFSDADKEMAARFFAMLCHSGIYQPTFRNRALSLAQIGRELIQDGGSAFRALKVAWKEYRTQVKRSAELMDARS